MADAALAVFDLALEVNVLGTEVDRPDRAPDDVGVGAIKHPVQLAEGRVNALGRHARHGEFAVSVRIVDVVSPDVGVATKRRTTVAFDSPLR